MKKETIFLVGLLLTGCQNEDSKNISSKSSSFGKQEERMVIGKTYNINSGDEIVKLSSNPKLLIESNLELNTTQATLIEGEALLIKAR